MAARRLPIGAEVLPGGGVHYRVWAPRHEHVEVVSNPGGSDLEGKERILRLNREENGYFSGVDRAARAGTLYRFRVGHGDFPDPASRFQPEGPHGPSQVVDPSVFTWTDASWKGPDRADRVIYEMHIGTFTPEGTWRAAAGQLAELRALGMTVLEILPVGDFPGRFGWGYDGVNFFAPSRLYGTPDDMRRFVNHAHALGLGVILDVIYNHFGPDGNYIGEFSADYLSSRHATEWGPAINFDGPSSAPVREFVLANAGYWIDEFHLDGFRIDAAQSIFDDSTEHILAAIGTRVRSTAGRRRTLIVAESEPQDTRLVRPAEQGGYGLDAIWSEDFHHVAMITATGRREAYYSDYHGTAQELVSLARRGVLYQGQWNVRQGKRRGTPAQGVPLADFVFYLQNHDQVANASRGERIHHLTSPAQWRALTTYFLLLPQTPMLFQGQEFAASTPFFYFGDHNPELANLMYVGRQDFLSQFPSLATPLMKKAVPRPDDPEIFHRSKLDPSERQRHTKAYALHRDLFRLRKEDGVLGPGSQGRIDGAVLGPRGLVLRYFGDDEDDRLLLVNLGAQIDLVPAAEPLLAPPADAFWNVIFSSEHPRYGGSGVVPMDSNETWQLTGESAVVLSALKREARAHE